MNGEIADKIIIEMTASIREWQKDIINNERFGDTPIVSDILYGLVTMLSGLGGGIIGAFIKLSEGVIRLAVDLSVGLVFNPINSVFDELAQTFIKEGYLSQTTLDIVNSFAQSSNQLAPILKTIIYIFLAQSNFQGIQEIANIPTQKQILNKIRPMIPDINQLLRNIFIYKKEEDQYRNILHNHGYNDDNIDIMLKSMRPIFDESTLRLFLYRGIKSEPLIVDELKKRGYDDDSIEDIIKSWEVIPSIQDLLFFVGKEAFEPDQINKYQLESEFPYEQKEWLEKQGLSEYWQKKYWIAHWNYPSVGQVLEALHRGKITEKDVYEYYKVVEMPPYWRDLLIKLSYRPYTRVDVRRMHAFGVLNEEDVIKSYKDIGYDDEKAEKMSKFTIEYNKKQKHSMTKQEILGFFKDGIITEQDTILYLEELGYERRTIQFYVEKINISIQKEYIKELIKTLRLKYIQNEIGTGEIFSSLSRVNLSTSKIENYIDKWDLEKRRVLKFPSKEDLMTFLMQKIITEKEFSDHMRYLNYSEKHIDWYLRLIENKEV